MKFEHLLFELGDEGRFQIWIIILLLLSTSFFNAFFEPLLMLSKPDHWCRIPELEHLPNEIQHKLIRPYNNQTDAYESCLQYSIDYSSANVSQLELLIANQTRHIPCQHGWSFDKSLYLENAVSYFELVCQYDYLVNMILSTSWLAVAVLTPILSHMSDRYGRRKTLLLTIMIGMASCVSPLITKNFYVFVLARFFFNGILNVSYQLPFVMTLELVSQRYRTRASCLSALFYSLGACGVPLMAKYTRSWVNFVLVQFLIFLSYLLAFKWIPESSQWLISNHKYEQAYDQLIRVCQVNRRKVPDDLMEKIKTVEKDEKGDEEDDSFIQLLIRPGLRSKTFNLTFTFVACTVGYFGIQMNTTNMEATSQLYNVLLLAFIDIPALLLCWYLVETRFGRRWTNAAGLAICGISMLIPAIFSSGPESYLTTVCTSIGKFGIAGTYMVVYQMASELFPTTLRNQGVGICATVSSLIAIFVPQMVYLAKFGAWIPLFIIAVTNLIAAVCASFLPETLNEYLPQRAREAAEFGANKRYFSWARVEPLESKSEKSDDQPVAVISKSDL